MLKKFFYGMMAATMLVATSCTDEPMVGGDEATVSFSISTPEIATRAYYSDGMTANELHYAIYDNGVLLGSLTGTEPISQGKANIQLQLKTGKTYKAIFWADNEAAPYTVDFAAKTMTINYAGVTSNNENYDAFYKAQEITVKGDASINVELRRPFAQINIGTNDYDKAQKAGYTVNQTWVKVPAYNTLNLWDGSVNYNGSDIPQTQTFALANIPPSGETFPVSGYDYLAMNYVLVGNTQELVDVEFGLEDGVTERKIGSVPVRRNYRTNLYGSLLTSNQDVNVEIKPGYDGTENEEVPGYANVSNAAELAEALGNEEVGVIVLDGDINLNELLTLTRSTDDPSLTIKAGKTLTLDLNGKTLSAKSYQTGKNYNMIDVHGALTVKNGTINYEHKGQDMGWNNYAEIFHVDFGGTLNLEGVKANNAGGSAMAYVIDMTNGTDITVNVKNSELVSTYIPVRVFNNNKNGVHNVAINNSKLNGEYCFWVQYWLADGRDQETLKRTLNLDIFDETNEYTYNVENAGPVLFGFNNYLYLDKDGYGYYTENKTHYVYTGNALVTLSGKTIKGGEKVVLTADIDLTGVEFNGINAFNPENNNTFDGQGFTVSNWTYTGKKDDMGFIKNWVGPIKNVNFENCNLKTGGRSAIVAAKPYGDIENVHVSNSVLNSNWWACGLIAGMHNSGNVVNCSVTNSSVKSTGGTGAMVGVVNETSGTRKFENCNVVGCTIENGGDNPYSGAALAGLINVDNLTLKFINCKQENNKFIGNACYDAFSGYNAGDNTNVVNE